MKNFKLFLVSSYLFLITKTLFAAEPAKEVVQDSLLNSINQVFGTIVGHIATVLFFPVFRLSHPIADKGEVSLPFIIALLGVGGLFFTIRFAFVNVKLFKHAIQVVQGKFDDPNDHGEISHFKALTSALSATVGLGNIAGVAVAISTGGPGAVFWMWLVAFMGMSMKFASCTLAQLYRKVDSRGRVLGGPMVYLEKGLAEMGLVGLGKFFAILFAVLTIMASFGGGNMFQGNQMAALIGETAYGAGNPIPDSFKWIVGLILAAMVGAVILGGIKRIGAVTSKLVPAMVVFYCSVCLIIIIGNIGQIPAMFSEIFFSSFLTASCFWWVLRCLSSRYEKSCLLQ